MTRSEFASWIQDTFLGTLDRAGPDCLGNIDDRLLFFMFPDGSRFDHPPFPQGDHAGKHPALGKVHVGQGTVLLMKLFERAQ